VCGNGANDEAIENLPADACVEMASALEVMGYPPGNETPCICDQPV
jgi:alpha-galactosidase/6-phospho-beta-glucosidase family protein